LNPFYILHLKNKFIMRDARAYAITRRTYNRPLNDEGTIFETWDQTINRVVEHQKWLWEKAVDRNLNSVELAELEEFRELTLSKKCLPAGRTLWLGNTDIAKTVQCCQFNCAFLELTNVYDFVDAFWLLLNGCGVGFKPVVGSLNGFTNYIKTVIIIGSERITKGGEENNKEFYITEDGKTTWRLKIGDSAKAWAKSLGKLLANKKKIDTLILDFSEIRPDGIRLKGYGWISSGWKPLAKAYEAIVKILNSRVGQLLTKMDIMDIANWVGTVLSSRRCLPENTAIYTDKGIKPIENIKIGDFVYDSKGNLNKVTNTFDQGKQKTIIIKSQIGDFQCTKNHKVAVMVKLGEYIWKNAGELNVGDRLVAPHIVMNWKYNPLPDIINITEDARAIKYKMPILDTSFAWFIGYFIGNGSVPITKKQGIRAINVAIPNIESLVSRVVEQMNRFSSHLSISSPREDNNCYKISLNNTNIANWFKKHIKPFGSEGAYIPDFIKNNTAEIRAAFMAGLLDSDGSLGKPTNSVNTVSEQLYKDCIEVYVSLGIHVRTNKKQRIEPGWQDIYTLNVVGDYTKENWYNLLIPYSFKLQSTEYRFESQNSFGFPAEWLVDYKTKGWAINSKQMTVGRFIKAGNIFDKLIPIEVVTIEEAEIVQTYDLEVENVHEFIAGSGLLVHNSAEIALFEYGKEEWEEFAEAKKEFWIDNPQRSQSNNSVFFESKPSKAALEDLFYIITNSGGSEPGFINMEAARKRAPWVAGVNPCSEILLPSNGFCNLVDCNINAFDSFSELLRAIYIMARANYRQTCVNLKDGILQDTWHENNEYLRLCGVGLTGIAMRPDLKPYDFKQLKNQAIVGAYSMADELGTPRPKNVTTIKPSGSVSKLMSCTEGAHKPLGKYIFNNVIFSKHDPLLGQLKDAGYRTFDHPVDEFSALVTFPIKYDGVVFDKINGKEINIESALSQLNRYKTLMENYVEQNCSITISYDISEINDIVDWLLLNWESYIGVSFIYRNDAAKTAKDLGYQYLPQEVVTEETYNEYIKELSAINEYSEGSEAELVDDCIGGACPIR